MESRLPVPTDNIFKFYALFGLLLFVFSCGASLYVSKSANEVLFAAIPELTTLSELEQPSLSEQAKIAVLKKRVEITTSDRKTLHWVIGSLIAISWFAMYFGFSRWHRHIQPILDRTAKAQMEIAELQLVKLRRELGIEQQPATAAISDEAAPKLPPSGL